LSSIVGKRKEGDDRFSFEKTRIQTEVCVDRICKLPYSRKQKKTGMGTEGEGGGGVVVDRKSYSKEGTLRDVMDAGTVSWEKRDKRGKTLKDQFGKGPRQRNYQTVSLL